MDVVTPLPPKLGLVLPGGGARAAYQAGVLAAIAEMLPPAAPNPFPVITGTSAGAINAAIIATHALHFRRGAEQLAAVWAHMHSDLVFRTDALTIVTNLLRWLINALHPGFGSQGATALLDNLPLRRLLERHIVFARVQEAIDAGLLDALCVTCSGYTSARAVCFYQGKHGLKPWHRSRRLGQPVDLRLDHIMASVALPMIFPAVRLGREYYGDGSLRQMAPLSPPIHFGAERVLIVGVRNEQPTKLPEPGERVPYPSLSQVAGYLLDVVFSDTIYADLERLQRINLMVREMAPQCAAPPPFRDIQTMLIVPSGDIREIARRHLAEFPRSVRFLLRTIGGTRHSGSQFASYLLFEQGYCRELVELGKKDARAQADKLLTFLRVTVPATDKPPVPA